MSYRLLKLCGMSALVVCATCLSLSEAQAGGRRWTYSYQPTYYYQPGYTVQTYPTYSTPAYRYSAAPVYSNAPGYVNNNVNGRVRYQSAYQAPVNSAPVYTAPAYTGPVYYNSSPDFDPAAQRNEYFVPQWSSPDSYNDLRAGRKIYDGGARHKPW